MQASSDRIAQALGLINAGQVAKAEVLCRSMASEEPTRADAAHLLAILALRERRYEDALERVSSAIEAAPDTAPFRNTLGTIQRQLGDHGAAVGSFRKALTLDPGAQSIRLNLIDCLHHLGHYDQAAPHCRALRRDPQGFLAQGNQFLGEDRIEKAIQSFRQCVAAAPKFGFGLFRLATAYALQGDLDAAIAAFEAALAAEPGNSKYYYHLSISLLNAGRADEACKVCDSGLSRAADDVRLLSIKVLALQKSGVGPDGDVLAGWASRVKADRIATPEEFDSLDAFNRALMAHIEAHPSLAAAPPGNATRHGDHTGELMVAPLGPLAAFEKLVREAVEAYCEGRHEASSPAFCRDRPARLGLAAWAVLMKSGGHQVPHIHPSGWLSGVYYLSVPPAVAADDPAHAGWIEFGRPGPLVPDDAGLEFALTKPEEGLLVLFPSYLYHRTIPFEDTRRRVCIAFDLVPETDAGPAWPD